MARTSPLISATDLKELMENDKILLVDARTGPAAREEYRKAHLDGAKFADMEKDLSQKSADPAQGGRHPLPPVEDFTAVLGRLGIDPASHVVVYDDKAGANAAARFWWMLKAMGHQDIQVLDGGFQAALEAGIPLSDKVPEASDVPPYPADNWILPIADAEAVARAVKDPDYIVIDVRESFRFKGESEPIDTIAGHIPGAVNIPFSGNLDAKGHFLSAEVLEEKYEAAIGDRENRNVIIHCGSGVTACHSILAMEHAGLDIPALYVGSWSEWSRNDRPMAVGE